MEINAWLNKRAGVVQDASPVQSLDALQHLGSPVFRGQQSPVQFVCIPSLSKKYPDRLSHPETSVLMQEKMLFIFQIFSSPRNLSFMTACILPPARWIVFKPCHYSCIPLV
jgi:hypothetical protein